MIGLSLNSFGIFKFRVKNYNKKIDGVIKIMNEIIEIIGGRAQLFLIFGSMGRKNLRLINSSTDPVYDSFNMIFKRAKN